MILQHLPPSHESGAPALVEYSLHLWTPRSNTPKEVLLLAELAEIMKVMEVEDMKGCMSGHL